MKPEASDGKNDYTLQPQLSGAYICNKTAIKLQQN